MAVVLGLLSPSSSDPSASRMKSSSSESFAKAVVWAALESSSRALSREVMACEGGDVGNRDVRKVGVEITGNLCFVGYLLVDVHSDLQQPYAGILFCYELLFYQTFFKGFCNDRLHFLVVSSYIL